MVYALGLQRLLAGAAAVIALLWAGLAGVPLVGLWAAVWVIGLSSVGIGALVSEHAKARRNRDVDVADPEQATSVMVSGFGYLTVGMLAGWFHPVITATLLTGALVDFAASHRLVRWLRTV